MRKTKRSAFTIVELVIVIAVIAILSAVMIPTFGSIIKSANISADKAEAATLTTQLNLNLDGIKTQKDLYDVIEKAYGEEGAKTFAPRSAQHGYHYWYDAKTNRIELAKYSELDGIIADTVNYSTGAVESGAVALAAVTVAANGYTPFEVKNFRSVKDGRFFLLDRGGSELAETLSKIDNLGDTVKFGDILTALAEITGEDKEIAVSAAAKLSTTAVVAIGTSVASADAVIDYVYISHTVDKLLATDVVINNNVSLDVTLPSNVKFLNSYSLAFKTTSNLHVNATENELKTMLGADSMHNCNIVLNGVYGYTVEGTTLKKPTGDTIGDLVVSEASKVASVTLKQTASVANKVELGENDDKLYVAVDFNGDITLDVLDFRNADGDKITVRGEKWAVKSGNITYEDGKFKVTGFADDDAAYVGEITVSVQNFTKTINVYGVKAVNVVLNDLDNPNLIIDREANGGDNKVTDVTITMSYNPTADNSFSFTPSLVLNHSVTTIVLDNQPTVTDPEGKMSYSYDTTTSKGTLKLPANTFEGKATTTLKISYGTVESDVTYVVNLINKLDDTFAINEAYVTTQTYKSLEKYYVGNSGTFEIGYLFKVKEGKEIPADQKVIVEVYQAGSSTGIPAYDDEFADLEGKINLSGEELASLVGKDITIKIGLTNSPDRAEITVGFIAATNVTKENEATFTASSSTNIVLLSDIDMSSAKTLCNIYGNLHKINVNTGSNKGSGYWPGFITLHGTMDNTLVIGPTYDAIKLNDHKQAWDGVLLVAANSTITNSYLYGFRAPVAISASNCTIKIENTTIEGGAYCNIHIARYKELILNNVDLVQDYAGYTVGSKKAYGLGVLFDDSGCKGTVTLAGNTNLYNWINKTEGEKFNNTAIYSLGLVNYTTKNLIDKMVDLGEDEGYLHNSNYVNTGFVQVDGDNKVEWIQQDDDARGPKYTGSTYSKAGNIRLLIKTYTAWSIPTCTDTCTHTSGTFLPEGWSHQNSNHSEAYLNSRIPAPTN